ncbi:MAG: glycosyltransferase family 4 protein [Verrucomicrobiaceae bacterium]|nr:glycosyltransferase family 4 protein [Verrucomicrobiaceae bacterium]
MKIAMFTNTYLPHVGGVARSVQTLEEECRKRGHRVKVVAPEFDDAEESPHVLRVPAIQHFNGSDFSVRLPAPALVRDCMDEFEPDVIHSHHPFLLGDTALRQAWRMEIPVVFTHHTLYERYTHYVPLDSPTLRRMAIQLATEYCNLCSTVIAPSESIRDLLVERGVTVPIVPIPTGIDTDFFSSGDGERFRRREGLPEEALVIGHVGRLAAEKNLEFLAEALALFLKERRDAVFLLVGEGDAGDPMETILEKAGAGDRVFRMGALSGTRLADAYAAMDVFVFASQSETQGMVLAEAMAAGKPVVALDGPGVREIVIDGANGFLLPGASRPDAFAEALRALTDDAEAMRRRGAMACSSAMDFDHQHCAREVTDLYERLIGERPVRSEEEKTPWDPFLNSLEIEWDLFAAKMSAAATGMMEPEVTEVGRD